MSEPLLPERLSKQSEIAAPAAMLSALLEQQMETWAACREGYQALAGQARKICVVHGDPVIVECNPKRLASISANIDPQAVGRRPCFLCEAQRPPEQAAVMLSGGYLGLVNPRPIFRRHFTIISPEHAPQALDGRTKDLLNLASQLSPSLALLFNGARAGASAPDHLHFQACEPADLPLAALLAEKPRLKPILETPNLSLDLISFCSTRYLMLTGTDQAAVIRHLAQLLDNFSALQKNSADMINLLILYQDSRWKVVIIPRTKHRPSCYFKDSLLISPATVEMCGRFITARKEDFERIDAAVIAEILDEVAFDASMLL